MPNKALRKATGLKENPVNWRKKRGMPRGQKRFAGLDGPRNGRRNETPAALCAALAAPQYAGASAGCRLVEPGRQVSPYAGRR